MISGIRIGKTFDIRSDILGWYFQWIYEYNLMVFYTQRDESSLLFLGESHNTTPCTMLPKVFFFSFNFNRIFNRKITIFRGRQFFLVEIIRWMSQQYLFSMKKLKFFFCTSFNDEEHKLYTQVSLKYWSSSSEAQRNDRKHHHVTHILLTTRFLFFSRTEVSFFFSFFVKKLLIKATDRRRKQETQQKKNLKRKFGIPSSN